MEKVKSERERQRDFYWALWLSHARELVDCAKREWDGVLALAGALAPVLGARCPTCGKAARVLWYGVGEHSLCNRLQATGTADVGKMYQSDDNPPTT